MNDNQVLELPPEVAEVFRKAIMSKNLLTIAYFSILLFLEEDDLDEDIFKFHLQRHQGQFLQIFFNKTCFKKLTLVGKMTN